MRYISKFNCFSSHLAAVFAQLRLSDEQFYILLRCVLYWRFYGNCEYTGGMLSCHNGTAMNISQPYCLCLMEIHCMNIHILISSKIDDIISFCAAVYSWADGLLGRCNYHFSVPLNIHAQITSQTDVITYWKKTYMPPWASYGAHILSIWRKFTML